MGRSMDGQGGRHHLDLHGNPYLIGRRKGNSAYWSRGIAVFQKLGRRNGLIAIVSIWFHDLAKKIRPLFPVTMYAACLFSFVLGVSYLLE
ncbi:MAG: hypothetical protein ACQEXQ_03920 [Bacillota bacterium]